MSRNYNATRSAHGSRTDYAEAFKIVLLIIVWYVFNVLYNLDHKHATNMLPLPWLISSIQLLVGWFFFLFAWMFQLRKFPKIYNYGAITKCVVSQGFFHTCVHLGATISMKYCAMSFTHVVKASEPALSAILSILVLGNYLHIFTYLCILPIVFGIGIASANELSFTWCSFGLAMISTMGSACRSICAKLYEPLNLSTYLDRVNSGYYGIANGLSKSNKRINVSGKNIDLPQEVVGDHLTPPNVFALVTIVATLISFPLAFYFEGQIAISTWNHAVSNRSPYDAWTIVKKILLSGFWYYAYNELSYICLHRLNQVTHAVANTLKRVAIIAATVIVFRIPVSFLGGVGSLVALFGALCYSVSKAKYG